MTVVWAYRPLPELNRATGFVECDDDLAADLIKSGRAQSLDVGALHFRQIEGGTDEDGPDDGQKRKPGRRPVEESPPSDTADDTYQTREMTAEPPKSRKK